MQKFSLAILSNNGKTTEKPFQMVAGTFLERNIEIDIWQIRISSNLSGVPLEDNTFHG